MDHAKRQNVYPSSLPIPGVTGCGIAHGNPWTGIPSLGLTGTTDGRPGRTRALRDHPHRLPQPGACLSRIFRSFASRSIEPHGSGARSARFLRVGQRKAVFTSSGMAPRQAIATGTTRRLTCRTAQPPTSSRICRESSLLTGPMILAGTRCRNTSSPPATATWYAWFTRQPGRRLAEVRAAAVRWRSSARRRSLRAPGRSGRGRRRTTQGRALPAGCSPLASPGSGRPRCG
jgi:hypothetical protein